MKRFLALGLAAAVSLTSLAAFPSAASAHSWKGPYGPYGYGYYQPQVHYYPQHYYYPQPYDPGPAIVAGAIFGAIFGALPRIARVPRYRVYAGGNSHVEWCSWRYRTYNKATDTFFIRPGVPAVCISP